MVAIFFFQKLSIFYKEVEAEKGLNLNNIMPLQKTVTLFSLLVEMKDRVQVVTFPYTE